MSIYLSVCMLARMYECINKEAYVRMCVGNMYARMHDENTNGTQLRGLSHTAFNDEYIPHEWHNDTRAHTSIHVHTQVHTRVPTSPPSPMHTHIFSTSYKTQCIGAYPEDLKRGAVPPVLAFHKFLVRFDRIHHGGCSKGVFTAAKCLWLSYGGGGGVSVGMKLFDQTHLGGKVNSGIGGEASEKRGIFICFSDFLKVFLTQLSNPGIYKI